MSRLEGRRHGTAECQLQKEGKNEAHSFVFASRLRSFLFVAASAWASPLQSTAGWLSVQLERLLFCCSKEETFRLVAQESNLHSGLWGWRLVTSPFHGQRSAGPFFQSDRTHRVLPISGCSIGFLWAFTTASGHTNYTQEQMESPPIIETKGLGLLKGMHIAWRLSWISCRFWMQHFMRFNITSFSNCLSSNFYWLPLTIFLQLIITVKLMQFLYLLLSITQCGHHELGWIAVILFSPKGFFKTLKVLR